MTPPQLDAVDAHVLEELQRDARQTNRAVAATVGLAPSTTLNRVRELEQSGVIRGYHAEVDLAALRPWSASAGVCAVAAQKRRDRESIYRPCVVVARDDGDRPDLGRRGRRHPSGGSRCDSAADNRLERNQQFPRGLRRTVVVTVRTPPSPCCFAGAFRSLTPTE